MKKIIVISVKKPSNAGGAEIVWNNLKKGGFDFENISLDDTDLPFLYRKIPNIFHMKEIFASSWLLRKAASKNPDKIIYDKIFGWPKIKINMEKICYNHGSYTIAGLEFRRKNLFIYLFYRYIISYFEKRSYKNADAIIAVSESVKNEMETYFKIPRNKIILSRNSVNLKKFKPIKNKLSLRKKYNLPLNKKLIFFPGRASFGKGFDIAQEVLEELGENYFMFVLGKGKSKLNNIKFIGKINNDKMPEIYNCADLCLLPSRYEGSSISVLESAACGVPLILSGVGEMKTNKKMREFVCLTPEEYVKKMRALMENNQNYKKASKKWKEFSKKFSIEEQSKNLKEIIKK